MIKAIIFDCFGVLVGTGYWKTFERAGGNLAKDRKYLDDLLYRSSKGTLPSKELHRLAAERLNIPVEKWMKYIRDDEKPNGELFEYIKSTLKPRYKIGFLSNVARGGIDRIFPDDLFSLFDVRIISAEVGLAKPDPAIYRLAAERLETLPAECLYVDDNEPYLAGAQKAGMTTYLFESTEEFKRFMLL